MRSACAMLTFQRVIGELAFRLGPGNETIAQDAEARVKMSLKASGMEGLHLQHVLLVAVTGIFVHDAHFYVIA